MKANYTLEKVETEDGFAATYLHCGALGLLDVLPFNKARQSISRIL
jgi:hypothetical protein